MKKEIALVYLAGGISSRFGGKVKQLISVGPHGERLLEWSMLQALPAGFTKIVLIVGSMTAEPIRAVFGDMFQGVPIVYAMQSFDSASRDRPWGTVDALCAALPFLDCPFVVCNGDDLYGKRAFATLVQHCLKQSSSAMMGYRLGEVISEVPNNRAMLEVDAENKVHQIVETFGITRSRLDALQLTEERYCSMNLFAFYPEVLTLLAERLAAFKATHIGDRRSECLLPNELSALLEARAFVMQLYPAQEQWTGVTAPEDEERVRKELAQQTSA